MPRAFSFSCKRCGNCCTRADGRVRITEDDVPRIAAALDLSVAGFRSRYLNAGPDEYHLQWAAMMRLVGSRHPGFDA